MTIKIMKIRIDHIDKIEGHAGFVAHILRGDVQSAKIETQEGSRLIEGILIGRHYQDAPIITSRICGICPIIHNITAIKSIENALEIKVSPAVIKLRKLMLLAQVIHSHGLHLFFLTLPDYCNISNDLQFTNKYSLETEKALLIRNFGLDLARIIGGRTIHPITSEVGGFKKLPNAKELSRLVRKTDKVLRAAIDLACIFRDLEYPDLRRRGEYISLQNKKEYPFFDGEISSFGDKAVSVRDFTDELKEIICKGEKAKRAKYKGKPFMLGAISRLNNNYKNLNPEADKILKSFSRVIPFENNFYNIFAQAVELVHCIEEVSRLTVDLQLPKKISATVKTKKGVGVAACEAPRGTLIHSYALDKNGYIEKCNIITPTAQVLNNLEEDLKSFLPNLKKMDEVEMKIEIRKLIRAYDPCITCSTH